MACCADTSLVYVCNQFNLFLLTLVDEVLSRFTRARLHELLAFLRLEDLLALITVLKVAGGLLDLVDVDTRARARAAAAAGSTSRTARALILINTLLDRILQSHYCDEL